jgi:hypothetical protein
MVTYRVPVLIKGHALVRYPEGKAAGDYIGGLPRDAESEVRLNTPFLCGARMVDVTVELTGPAQRIE